MEPYQLNYENLQISLNSEIKLLKELEQFYIDRKTHYKTANSAVAICVDAQKYSQLFRLHLRADCFTAWEEYKYLFERLGGLAQLLLLNVSRRTLEAVFLRETQTGKEFIPKLFLICDYLFAQPKYIEVLSLISSWICLITKYDPIGDDADWKLIKLLRKETFSFAKPMSPAFIEPSLVTTPAYFGAKFVSRYVKPGPFDYSGKFGPKTYPAAYEPEIEINFVSTKYKGKTLAEVTKEITDKFLAFRATRKE